MLASTMDNVLVVRQGKQYQFIVMTFCQGTGLQDSISRKLLFNAKSFQPLQELSLFPLVKPHITHGARIVEDDEDEDVLSVLGFPGNIRTVNQDEELEHLNQLLFTTVHWCRWRCPDLYVQRGDTSVTFADALSEALMRGNKRGAWEPHSPSYATESVSMAIMRNEMWQAAQEFFEDHPNCTCLILRQGKPSYVVAETTP